LGKGDASLLCLRPAPRLTIAMKLALPLLSWLRSKTGWTINSGISISNNSPLSDIEAAAFNVKFVSRFTQDMTVLLNGDRQLASHSELADLALSFGVRINAKLINKLIYEDKEATMKITFSDGMEESFGMVFHKPETRLKGDFGEQLRLELSPSGEFKVSTPMQ
jgi:hypothetical protein